MQVLNTLYVTTPESYLHLENDTVRIEVEHETRLRVPLHHVGTVVCFGNVMLSTPLMHRLADSGIGLVLLDGHGRFKARLEGSVSGNVLLRQAQYERSRDPTFALGIARCCVAGKIRNARQVLLRGARVCRPRVRRLDGFDDIGGAVLVHEDLDLFHAFSWGSCGGGADSARSAARRRASARDSDHS